MTVFLRVDQDSNANDVYNPSTKTICVVRNVIFKRKRKRAWDKTYVSSKWAAVQTLVLSKRVKINPSKPPTNHISFPLLDSTGGVVEPVLHFAAVAYFVPYRWLGEAPIAELRDDRWISGACSDTSHGITTCVKVPALQKAQLGKVGTYDVYMGRGRPVSEFVEDCIKLTSRWFSIFLFDLRTSRLYRPDALIRTRTCIWVKMGRADRITMWREKLNIPEFWGSGGEKMGKLSR